jgi:hypothetical protein
MKKRTTTLLLSIAIASVIMFSIYTFAGTTGGAAYDWRNGEIINNYGKVANMGPGWTLISFISEYEDGSSENFEMWTPVSNPAIGSRDLKSGDTGEDVTALQKTINLLRVSDPNDSYYFREITNIGTYDENTEIAVFVLQEFFDLEATGLADLSFQSSLYKQITTPGE